MESESEGRRPVKAAVNRIRSFARPVTGRASVRAVRLRDGWKDSRSSVVKGVTSWGWELAFLTAVGIGAMLWFLPEFWADRSGVVDPQDRADLENSFRSTLAQIVGGFVLLVALYSTLRRVRAAERTVEITEQGQITERFTRAIEQLGTVHDGGKINLEVRLGGIYALERIARESEQDFWPIMEVLTAYVRENAPFVKPERKYESDGESVSGAGDESERQDDRALAQAATSAEPRQKPRTDIQAVLTVLGRRVVEFQRNGEVLDLSETDLRGASLSGVHMGRDGSEKQFDLTRAILMDASLDGADLRDASLDGASLGGAKMSAARRVSQQQIDAANGGAGTELPEGIDRPAHW